MSEPALPKLRVSREEAREKITAQGIKGNQILLSLTSAPKVLPAFKATFEKAKSDQGKWATFTVDLLKTLFIDMQIGKEFGDADRMPYTGYQYDIVHFVTWMNTRIDRLDSILERLDLFPSVGVPNKAVQLVIPRSLLRGSSLLPSCFRGVFEIEFCDTPQLAAGSFILKKQVLVLRRFF